MALVVEDGTGLETADSYISMDDATAYVANYYLSNDPQTILWQAATSGGGVNAEVALRRATRDIDASYEFSGVPLVDTQALEFPRADQDDVPVEVENATVEMALLILGKFDPIGPQDKSGAVESEKYKLGGLETETTYFYATNTQSARLNKVETLLSPYLESDTFGEQIELVRG
jgi:hypothetical protein